MGLCNPYPYDNSSDPWDEVKTHLQGVWYDTDIGPDIQALQTKIKGLSHAHLTSLFNDNVAKNILTSIQNSVNPTMWWSNLIHIGITAVIIIILIFPVLFRIILSSTRSVSTELKTLKLKK